MWKKLLKARNILVETVTTIMSVLFVYKGFIKYKTDMNGAYVILICWAVGLLTIILLPLRRRFSFNKKTYPETLLCEYITCKDDGGYNFKLCDKISKNISKQWFVSFFETKNEMVCFYAMVIFKEPIKFNQLGQILTYHKENTLQIKPEANIKIVNLKDGYCDAIGIEFCFLKSDIPRFDKIEVTFPNW